MASVSSSTGTWNRRRLIREPPEHVDIGLIVGRSDLVRGSETSNDERADRRNWVGDKRSGEQLGAHGQPDAKRINASNT